MIATIHSVASLGKLGMIKVQIDNVTATYRYQYTDDLAGLRVGDLVVGNLWGGSFNVLYKAPEPCPLIKVDFKARRYAVERSSGEVVGWMEPKKGRNKWTA